jgi:hypothetical protein
MEIGWNAPKSTDCMKEFTSPKTGAPYPLIDLVSEVVDRAHRTRVALFEVEIGWNAPYKTDCMKEFNTPKIESPYPLIDLVFEVVDRAYRTHIVELFSTTALAVLDLPVVQLTSD